MGVGVDRDLETLGSLGVVYMSVGVRFGASNAARLLAASRHSLRLAKRAAVEPSSADAAAACEVPEISCETVSSSMDPSSEEEACALLATKLPCRSDELAE